jgi:hypothetical protein
MPRCALNPPTLGRDPLLESSRHSGGGCVGSNQRPLHSEGLAAAVSRICRRPRRTTPLSRRRGRPRMCRLSHADGMLIPACGGGGGRLGRSECATRSKCFVSSRYTGRSECAGRRGCAGGSGYGRPRLLRATSDFDGRRRLMVLRDSSGRHVGNDRRRRRLIGGQTGVGILPRVQERIEPNGE